MWFLSKFKICMHQTQLQFILKQMFVTFCYVLLLFSAVILHFHSPHCKLQTQLPERPWSTPAPDNQMISHRHLPYQSKIEGWLIISPQNCLKSSFGYMHTLTVAGRLMLFSSPCFVNIGKIQTGSCVIRGYGVSRVYDNICCFTVVWNFTRSESFQVNSRR